MVKVSKMSGKLEGIEAINTNPLSNQFCKRMAKTDAVCSKCYATRALKGVRKNCVASYESNGEELTKIGCEIPKINGKLVRFHAFGELINAYHLINFINIAKAYPDTTFVLWSKRKDLVAKYYDLFPANMWAIYSTPTINCMKPEIPEGFEKVFSVYTKKLAPIMNINCGGRKCIECMNCYNKGPVKFIQEVMK